jgi:GTPase SAR1 family protein
VNPPAAALLVFDITDVDSFQRVKKWVRELKKMAGAFSDLVRLKIPTPRPPNGSLGDAVLDG